MLEVIEHRVLRFGNGEAVTHQFRFFLLERFFGFLVNGLLERCFRGFLENWFRRGLEYRLHRKCCFTRWFCGYSGFFSNRYCCSG